MLIKTIKESYDEIWDIQNHYLGKYLPNIEEMKRIIRVYETLNCRRRKTINNFKGWQLERVLEELELVTRFFDKNFDDFNKVHHLNIEMLRLSIEGNIEQIKAEEAETAEEVKN